MVSVWGLGLGLTLISDLPQNVRVPSLVLIAHIVFTRAMLR